MSKENVEEGGVPFLLRYHSCGWVQAQLGACPDFKFGPGKCARELSRTPWYWDTVTNNLKLLYEWEEDYVIRHLIMPNHVECCTKPVLDWVARNMPEVPINIMDQYYPDNLCDSSSHKYRERYSELARSPTKEEIKKSYKYARASTLKNYLTRNQFSD